ncbi:MAG: lysophospholipid acyltransferase family protein [Alphaproteobacteria bacterium]|nr:lysophospholipid acyltransferase family protein [Alphaproteobacteria bacterium]
MTAEAPGPPPGPPPQSPPPPGRRPALPPKYNPVTLVKDLGGLSLYYPGQKLVSRSPRRWLHPVGAVGGDFVRLLAADGREMREELRLLFRDRPLPTDEATIIRDTYREAMFNEVEVLRYPDLNPDTIDDTCVIEGREHLDAALARGRGAIVLIGHFGANQMIMPALGHKGYPMNQLSAPPPVWADILRETRTTPLWEKVLARRWQLEQRLPVQHINVFKFLRPAFDCLRDNQVLGLAFDGGGGQKWTQVRLLERDAFVSIQPAQLWKKTGAALLPTVVVRRPGERLHRVIIEPALDWQPVPGDRDEEIRRNMQAFVDRFSAWVGRYPDHYLQFMLHRRRVRATDIRPFFDDYPALPDQMSAEQAERHLREAGGRT